MVTSNVPELNPLLRWIPGGCLVVEQGIVEAANAEAAVVLSATPEQLLGARLDSLVIEEHQPLVAELEKAIGSRPLTLEVRARGSLDPFELTYRPGFGGPTGAVVGVRSMLREYRLSALAGAELTHDQTTGLPNRLYLLSQLNERITASRARPLAIACVWIDELDGLRSSRGEHAVSRVLREVASRMGRRLRGPDLLGRLDESGFLALLSSEAPTKQIAEIGQRLRDEIAFPVDFNDTLISFTASIAVASIGADRPTLAEAVAAVEAAASRAKHSGGNHTEVFPVKAPVNKSNSEGPASL